MGPTKRCVASFNSLGRSLVSPVLFSYVSLVCFIVCLSRSFVLPSLIQLRSSRLFYRLSRALVAVRQFLADPFCVGVVRKFHPVLSTIFLSSQAGPALLGMSPTTIGEVPRTVSRFSKVAVTIFSDAPIFKGLLPDKKTRFDQTAALGSTPGMHDKRTKRHYTSKQVIRKNKPVGFLDEIYENRFFSHEVLFTWCMPPPVGFSERDSGVSHILFEYAPAWTVNTYY